jgi:DNA polymerase I-like protein with 3'-5' exonuclease and polymerase domains
MLAVWSDSPLAAPDPEPPLPLSGPDISLPGPAQPEIPGVRPTPSPARAAVPSLADMFSSEGVFAAIGEAIGPMQELTTVERGALQTALREETAPPLLGQDWVTKTTQSDAPELSVLGSGPKPLSMIEVIGDYTPPPSDKDYTPDDPPSLDGIDEIILNVETKGLKWWAGEGVIGITVGTLDGQMCRFLPFGFRGSNLDEATVKRWAERELRGKAILNTHTSFDIHHMREWGIDLDAQGCTFADIQHYAALCDDHRKQFKLDALAKELLGEVRELRVDESHMADYDAGEVVDRAKYQIELVARLRDEFWPIMDAQNLHKVRAIEDSVIPVVVEMEKNAAVIDRSLLAEMTREAEAEYLGLLKQISTEVGFNFDDKPESWERLFINCGLEVPRLKSKKPSFDNDGLPDIGKATFKDEILARIDHPTIKLARYAAQLDSLRSKIFKPYTELVADDGTLRYFLNQLRSEEGGTVSGRFSAAYVQQVPNHDNHAAVFGEKYFPRRLYVPRRSASAASVVFVAADAAQIEYRLFANLAKNPKVLKAYQENPDASFHKMIHPMIAAFKPDIHYTNIKSLNFMRIYGGSLIKTAVMMGFISEEEGEAIHDAKNQWTEPKLAQARDISNIYDRELPEVKPLLRTAMHLAMPECDRYCKKDDEMHRKFQHRGYVTTLCGRRARFPTFHKIHKALNSVIQGTAADIMKMKLVEVYKERKRLGFTMRATVHDELWGDLVEKEMASSLGELLNTQSMTLTVPIRWSVGTGANWAEAK